MIPIEDAITIIEDSVAATGDIVKIPLLEANGRVLAVDVVSDIDIPPFNRVTMDGYAVVSSDGPGEYEVVEDVPAGKSPKVTLTPGKVSKIMTGAPLPEGADAVVMVEKTGGFADVGQTAEIKEDTNAGKNVSPRGEDVKTGQKVLSTGCVVRAPEASVLASMGHDPVDVYRLPTVAVLATGDELVDPGTKPGPGQIRNSNLYSTFAQCIDFGITPVSLGVARDDPDHLREKIGAGLNHDFLLLSGGVSAGDRDFVPGILKELGYEMKVHKVRIKPGKPVAFGVAPGDKYVFGMPGNPVSSMVIFEFFIKPALRKFAHMPGRGAAGLTATLETGYSRKNAGREEHVPVWLEWSDGAFAARTLDYHGSGHFAALTHANGLMKVPQDIKEIAAGETVEARLFNSGPLPMK